MKKFLILIYISTLFSTACEDVLDKQPLDIISENAVWSDPVLMDSYLDQCYAEMVFGWETRYGGGPNFGTTGFYSWFEQTFSLTIADEAKVGWSGAPKSNWITAAGGVEEWWGYPTVRKLNEFVERLDADATLTDEYRSQRIAEARYLRAHAYFNMVKRYGGVPLITEVQQLDDPEEELYPTRNSEEEIYDFVLSELDAIEADLVSAEAGRATKWTALALKSRAAMYAGSIASFGSVDLDGVVGIPSSEASRFWQASYDASEEIITEGGFELYQGDDKVANFRNLFLDEGNSEVIFAERFDGLAGKGQSYDMWIGPGAHHVWGAGHQAAAYLEMIESFDNIDGTSGMIDRAKISAGDLWTLDELWGNKDPRFKATIFTHGTSWMNGGAVLDFHQGIDTPEGRLTGAADTYKGVLANGKSARATPFGVLKYLDEEERSGQHERNHSDTDYIVFRLGEVLLNYAEAAMELDNDGDALWAVNELRTRAGMPSLAAISRDLVRKERKVELAFEGNRYWDLRRWRTAETELSQVFNGLRIVLDGDSYAEGAYDVLTAQFKLEIVPDIDGTPAPYFDAMHYYLPIGLDRTGANANLVENPGY
ncbi:MAG: RagB/SusD family nutrient uptake outer membrane protein [Reichenbachiella sp.]